MSFPKRNFLAFCNSLQVETRDFGIVTLGSRLLGTQTYLIDEISKAIDEGVHKFLVLKGRQLGITTICLALDLYYLGRYDGMQGALVTDDEANREMFRSTLSMYMDGLPPDYKHPISVHNRSQLVLKNRSRFTYMVAGKKTSNTMLGQGKALIYCHGTETASWGSEEGIASLEASFSETNPNRLYIFESTAHGYNHYEESWRVAKHSGSVRRIFIGWWRNELYALKKGSKPFDVYWDGRYSAEERAWMKEIKHEYAVEIQPEQIAWYRYTLAEKIKDEALMDQNFPHTADRAFVLSGSHYFGTNTINDRYKIAKQHAFDSYRIVMGEDFRDTELVDSRPHLATLKIWDMPRAGGYYMIGADPAYGSSEWADRFACEVYRCYADGMDQVAEFCTAECNTHQFAWVVAYLCGAYGENVMYNLEINGPGQQVYEEFKNLKRLALVEAPGSGFHHDLFNVLSKIRSFSYAKVDSLTGNPTAWHTQTNRSQKERMLAIMKDWFERGNLHLRSTELLEEMKHVVRDEDGFLGAPGRGKDDRVIATALAVLSWQSKWMVQLATRGITRAAARALDESGGVETPLGRAVGGWLKQIGVNAQ